MEVNGKMLMARYVKILDISVSGLSLKADRRLNIGSEYTLDIEGKGTVLKIKGIVVWSILGESIETPRGDFIPVYKAGMKFTDVSEEKMKEIENFIELHKKEVDREEDFEYLNLGELLDLDMVEKGKEIFGEQINLIGISSSSFEPSQPGEHIV